MIKSFFNVAGADAVKRIAEWIRHKFYTKAEIDEMFSAGAKYEVVDELPSTGVEGTIYLVPSSTSPSGDVYDEYIYVDGDFEKIGTTKADLANVVRVPTAGTAVGDTTHPVYVDADGEATAGSQYAGGTKLTLNGTDKGADSATAYAPTAGGTSGQYLKSNGSGNAPSWETMDTAPTENSTKAVTSGGVKTALDGKQPKLTGTVGSSRHPIYQNNGVLTECDVDDMLIKYCTDLSEGKSNLTTMAIAGSNRFAGMDSAHRYYEVSSDGTTWAASANGLIELGQRGRLVIHSVLDSDASYYVRTNINRLIFRIFGKLDITIELIKFNGGVTTYVLPSQGTDKEWHDIAISSFRFGDTKSATNSYIRTIRINYQHTPNTVVAYYNTRRVMDVYAIGRDWWNLASNEAKTGKSYTTNYTTDGEEVTFPSNVTAVKLIKSGGTNKQVLLANGDTASLPLSIANGGTGQTTAQSACNALINALSTGTSTPVDADYYVCQYAGGGTTTKTYHRRPMSALWTYIKGKISSALGIQEGTIDGKVNLQPDFTAQQMSYSAGNVGKWQKVLRLPEGADLVINMKKTAMGSDSTSTLWFSSSSMGDSYTSLFGNHSVRFVHDGGYVFLVLACKKSTNEPTEYYTFQIAHSSVPMSDIVAVTDASPITATPKEPSIVYRAPITTGAVSFNVSSSGTGSVAMSNHNDFLGNMTSEATNGVTVTMSGATEGQIYRFVFTRNIEGGVTFKQSNVAYCTIQGDVNAGDTITLTAVSNTENGWLYEQESAGMTSTDGSVSIDYSSGIPDLSVETIPFNNLVNKAMFQEGDSPNPLAVGEGAEAVRYDENGDILRYEAGQPVLISVDDDEKAYTHSITSGETYSVKIGNDTVSYTATATGRLFVCKTGVPFAGDSVMDGKWYINAMSEMMVRGAERVLNYYIIAVETNNNTLAQFDIISWINKPTNTYANYWNTAIGSSSKSLAYSSIAIGYSSAYGGFSLALHRGKALGYSSIAIGNSTANNYCLAIGNDANALFDNNCIAIGNSVMARGDRSLSLGCQNYSDGQEDVSLGVYCKSGRLVTRDSVNYDRLLIKKFPLAKFSVAGSQCFGYKNISNVSESVTLTYSGNSYVVNVEPNRTLMLVNDGDAVNIYESVFGGIEIDGVTYASVGSYSLGMFTLTHVVGNVYAITIFEGLEEYGDESSSSAYIYAHYTKSDYSSSYGIAVGNSCESVAGGKAFGQKLVAMNYYQTVLGRYNRLSDSSKFMIGGGTTDANRRNILEIDYDERLRVCSYVGETQTIEMNQQTGSLSNITKAVYRIRWDGTGTVNLTLDTGGCVEGQRVTIYAETNDVQIRFTSYLIPEGQFADFMFIAGAWRPYSGIGEVPTV